MTELRDFAYTDDGTAVVGATVSVTAAGNAIPTDSTTTDSTGMWEFTALPNDGYDVEVVKGSSTRNLNGNVSAQFSKITSYTDGITAPLEDESIDSSMLKNITADTATVPAASSNSIEVWLGGLSAALKGLTGEADWWDVPATDYSALSTEFSTHTHNGTDAPQVTLHPTTAAVASSLSILETAWVDGASLSLTAGTWLILATAELDNTQVYNTTSFTDTFQTRSSLVSCKIWDGTTDFAVGSNIIYPTTTITVSLHALKVLAAPATVKLSCKEDPTHDGGIVHLSTNSHITAIRVA